MTHTVYCKILQDPMANSEVPDQIPEASDLALHSLLRTVLP